MATGNDSRAKVLVLDADRKQAAELSHRLKFLDYDPIIGDSADALADRNDVTAVIVDCSGDDAIARTASEIRSQHPGLPFLCLSSDLNNEHGPNWSVELPLKRAQLERLLGRAERYQGAERRHRITGTSHPIRTVRRLIEQVADFYTNGLVTGQSGTGKELVARTIHDLSDRADKPFVPINCGAIPADLLESELFGHEKGAFTGAISARQGRFELAEGGVIFLDEIGDMPLPMQVKLLRVLQERCYEKVGSNKSIKTDVRVIAATHRRLEELIAEGKFREDLFYRLNVFPIEVPPLRERRSDIPLLIHEMISRIERENRGSVRLSKKAIAMLQQYDWPGNVRELANLIERLAILFPHGVVDSKDLPEKYQSPGMATEIETSDEHLPAAMASSDISELPSDGIDMKKYLTDIEISLIEQALSKTNNVVARAATMLNMRRTTLVEKMRKYEIERAE